MLPEALVALLVAALAAAQTRQTLALNQITSLNTTTAQPRLIPSASSRLAISVALCAVASPVPRFFVSNSSSSAAVPGPGGGVDVWEISLEDGTGVWEGAFPDGGVFAVDVGQGALAVPFDVGVSDSVDPLHETLSDLPLLGDTTSNQALLFSPPFSPVALPSPTYPNYTFPAANMSQPAPPSNPPNYTLALFATPVEGPRTACFLSGMVASGAGEGKVAEEKLWWRGEEEGWRKQWLVGGLTPATNYTAFALLGGGVSGPVWLGTKSAAFNCPLVHSLPYCPSISYAMPLPAPPVPLLAYTAPSLHDAFPTLVDPLLSYLANFTTTLGTFACGRDWYSPIVGCADCERMYRRWICAVGMGRCGEAPLSSSSSSSSAAAAATSGSVAAGTSGTEQAPLQPALTPQSPSTPARNTILPLPAFTSPYQLLLPCIEQCYQVDRACPPFIGFKCPSPGGNADGAGGGGAERSYGVGWVDDLDGGTGKGMGKVGSSADRWGGVWCSLL
ncbi:hypothetical protein BDN70DRAFT_817583 [Pholiota conissans]|uniref:Uncharacterized protein n=1 Tax=Pholiota conissans TaxID=109636 RepID=A0A9P6CUI9_9AGAR|nr:hypothetical protein BDN70DRAFT_817583 [Pholiota conissans]